MVLLNDICITKRMWILCVILRNLSLGIILDNMKSRNDMQLA